MEVNILADGEVLILALQGRLDNNTSQQVEETLMARVPGRPALVLDFAGLEYISSAGLRVMLKIAKQSRADGGKLALCGLAPQVREVFDISGFSTILSIHTDRSAALGAVK